MFNEKYITERLELIKANSTLLNKHFDEIFSLYSDDELMKYSGFGVYKNQDDLQNLFAKYFQKENFFLWFIIHKDTEKYIGDISLSADKMHAYASVACFLNKLYWGKGYMTEAMKELLFSFFAEYGFHRIEAQIHIDNKQSIRFFERFGFKYEGTLRHNFLLNGTFYDSKLYSMLFDEFIDLYAKK